MRHNGQVSDAEPTRSAGSEAAESDERPPRRARLLLSVALGLFLLDLVSKIVVVATLNGQPPVRLLGGAVYLTELRNTGAAWGLAAGMTIVFTLVAVVVVVVVLRTARNLRSTPWAWALGAVLAGALGNLVDRVFRTPGFMRGGVVDFISLFDPYGQVWPIFNVADSCLVCGGILAVLLALFGVEFDGTRHRRDDRPAAAVPDSSASDSSASDTAPDTAGTAGTPGDVAADGRDRRRADGG